MARENASVEDGRTFYDGASGRWAGERLLKALQENREISPAELRTMDTLRKDEWKAFDEALVEEGMIRLSAVADLMSAGLTIPVANAMGKTLFEYEKISDMNDAEVSLAGVSRTEDDRALFELAGLPLPIIHKDFNLHLRTLTASRTRGESLDTTQARIAGRKVSEKLEDMFFNGSKTYKATPIYGVDTEPNINTESLSGGAWDGTATGEQVLADVLAMKEALQSARFYGPYRLYIPSAWSIGFDEDFKAASDKSVRQRVMEVDGLQSISVADQCPAAKAFMIQWTRDVVALVNGEPLQSVQWDIEGGFIIKFKAMAIQIPLVRSTSANRSGVVRISA